MTTLVWFRDDLRIADNPALRAAHDAEDDVVCLYVLDEESDGVRPLGGATKWWLHHSLRALTAELGRRGVPLILRRGPAETAVREVIEDVGARRVVWNRRYGGAEIDVDSRIKEACKDADIEVHSFAANLLYEPWTVTTKDGTAYRVFSAFWRACHDKQPPREPLPAPRDLRAAPTQPTSDDLDDWCLLPTKPDWAGGLKDRWEPGERHAHARLTEFLASDVSAYAKDRDVPAIDATSYLSPHLRFGEISPYTVLHAAIRSGQDVGDFLMELGWREFAWHTAYHRPDIATTNIDRRFDAFEWATPDDGDLAAWRQGTTGVPLVDAGMRELWHTGYMHNRVRMVTASFLVKNLLIDWRVGEQWFWDTLVDADGASNPFNWQWVAGSGNDAAPYFRIFNPQRQRDRFDPQDRYITAWAPDSADRDAIVDLKASRQRALDTYARITGK